MAMVAEDGRERKMICLPLDFLNGWLFKIDANRYKNDFDRFNTIVTYQQKCYFEQKSQPPRRGPFRRGKSGRV